MEVSRKIMSEAAAWAEVASRPTLDFATSAALDRWMAQGEAHRAAFAEFSALWGSDALAEAANTVQRRQRSPMRVRFTAAAGVAAAAALAVAAFAPVLQFETIESARGAPSEQVLSDGSHVQLNGGSRLRIRQGFFTRTAFLDRGEAFFDVKHDGRPFRVSVGEAEVKVVGTAFNIDRRDTGRVEVDVFRGAVNFAAHRNPSQMLGAGQRGVMDADGRTRITAHGRVGDSPDWVDGWFDATDVTLGVLVEELNRFSEVPVSIDAPALAEMPVSGRFRVSQPETVLVLMHAAYGVEVTRQSDRIVLTGAADTR